MKRIIGYIVLAIERAADLTIHAMVRASDWLDEARESVRRRKQ